MFDPHIFNLLFCIFFSLSIFILLALSSSKIKAPYGKFASSSWGKLVIPPRIGWIIMESPSVIIFLIFYLFCSHKNKGGTALLLIWQFHYFYRSFIYPFLTKNSKKMSVMFMMSALIFQLVNTYFQAGWIYYMAPLDMYGGEYLTSYPFIVGVSIFLLGTLINRHSDHLLTRLRGPGKTNYQIPFGGMYRWVTCPNYLGEIIIWLGWAIMLKSWIGLSFFMWTIANLAPRAVKAHQWYLSTFPNYPKNRKSLIPYII